MLPLAQRHADLPSALWRRQAPSPLRHPRLIDLNTGLLARLGLNDRAWWQGPEALAMLSAAQGWPGVEPLAMKYGGHQFGGWNPDLGDGRGLLLGDGLAPDGSAFELHLKGAGPTPFSRMGDGRAVLRSCIREYLAGEALHALGVPTTRVAALAGSDEPVRRERMETAATVLRVAQSHIRFGHFEWLHHSGQTALLGQLADHVIARYYPHLSALPQRHSAFFSEVVTATARLMADWQRTGFAHGVMNTDNFSIVGETLDFGPYGFLETYDPYHICNHSDHNGRYAWYLQPSVGFWNLNALAHGLSPLIPVEALREALSLYEPTLIAHYDAGMNRRLGLDDVVSGDRELVQDWLALLQAAKADFNLSFRWLSSHALEQLQEQVMQRFPAEQERALAWLARYARRVQQAGCTEDLRQQAMKAVNPLYVLRNYLAEIAIKGAENGDDVPLKRLLEVVRSPFEERAEWSAYAGEAPAWGRCLEISCSS